MSFLYICLMYIFAYMGITPHTQQRTEAVHSRCWNKLTPKHRNTVEVGAWPFSYLLVCGLFLQIQTCSMILLAIISFASQASDRSHNWPWLLGTLDNLFLYLCYNISFLCVVGILARLFRLTLVFLYQVIRLCSRSMSMDHGWHTFYQHCVLSFELESSISFPLKGTGPVC